MLSTLVFRHFLQKIFRNTTKLLEDEIHNYYMVKKSGTLQFLLLVLENKKGFWKCLLTNYFPQCM